MMLSQAEPDPTSATRALCGKRRTEAPTLKSRLRPESQHPGLQDRDSVKLGAYLTVVRHYPEG